MFNKITTQHDSALYEDRRGIHRRMSYFVAATRRSICTIIWPRLIVTLKSQYTRRDSFNYGRVPTATTMMTRPAYVSVRVLSISAPVAPDYPSLYISPLSFPPSVTLYAFHPITLFHRLSSTSLLSLHDGLIHPCGPCGNERRTPFSQADLPPSDALPPQPITVDAESCA